MLRLFTPLCEGEAVQEAVYFYNKVLSHLVLKARLENAMDARMLRGRQCDPLFYLSLSHPDEVWNSSPVWGAGC